MLYTAAVFCSVIYAAAPSNSSEIKANIDAFVIGERDEILIDILHKVIYDDEVECFTCSRKHHSAISVPARNCSTSAPYVFILLVVCERERKRERKRVR